MSVISKLIWRNSTELKQATGEIATVGIFFAMRSCKYLKVAKPDQQRTKILRLRNVRFFQGLEQFGHNHRELEFADCIARTFEWQKKDKKMGGDPNGITRRLPMPGEGSCSNSDKDWEIPWLISGFPHLDSHSERTPRTSYVHTHDQCIERCNRNHRNRRDKTRHQEGGRWNALN